MEPGYLAAVDNEGSIDGDVMGSCGVDSVFLKHPDSRKPGLARYIRPHVIFLAGRITSSMGLFQEFENRASD